MASQESSSPPRPRLVVQIGVTGHRPNRLSPDAAASLPNQCEQVLRAIAALALRVHDPLLYSPEPPLLRILSPLAEGGDRIVAQAGLALGADLQCPLPFHIEEYCRDFKSDASREEFQLLLAKSSPLFRLTAIEMPKHLPMRESGESCWSSRTSSSPFGTASLLRAEVAPHRLCKRRWSKTSLLSGCTPTGPDRPASFLSMILTTVRNSRWRSSNRALPRGFRKLAVTRAATSTSAMHIALRSSHGSTLAGSSASFAMCLRKASFPGVPGRSRTLSRQPAPNGRE